MLSKDKLKRINELAKKAKETGLSQEETIEQQKLRKEYIAMFRGAFEETLHSVKIVDAKGTDVTPQKLKESQMRRKQNKFLH